MTNDRGGFRPIVAAGHALAYVVLLSMLALAWTMTIIDGNNTLARHAGWGSGKSQVEMGLMGSEPFRNDTQALAGNMLHLDAWHGYQEVMLLREVKAREVEFRARLGEGGYLLFVFGRSMPFYHDGGDYHAVRISLNPEKPSSWLDISPEGEFTNRHVLEVPGLAVDRWQAYRVVFGEGKVMLFVEGGEAGFMALENAKARHIGFRGGAHSCAVDDVRIVQDDGLPKLRETFDGYGEIPGRFAAVFVPTAFAVLVSGLLLLMFTGGGLRAASAATLSLVFTAALFSWSYWYLHRTVLTARYPVVAGILADQEESVRVNGLIRSRHLISKRYPRKARQGEKRIMFLGTSQTHGSGAEMREEAFVGRLEGMLGETRNVVVINAAVSGVDSKLLSRQYQDYLIQYEHSFLVVNLGNNDSDPVVFEQSLGEIVSAARHAGVVPVLCVEALSREESQSPPPLGVVLYGVAEKMNVPVFNLHDAIGGVQDTGLFWWDFVHPTSYGHKRMAEVLHPFLAQLMDALPSGGAVADASQYGQGR